MTRSTGDGPNKAMRDNPHCRPKDSLAPRLAPWTPVKSTMSLVPSHFIRYLIARLTQEIMSSSIRVPAAHVRIGYPLPLSLSFHALGLLRSSLCSGRQCEVRMPLLGNTFLALITGCTSEGNSHSLGIRTAAAAARAHCPWTAGLSFRRHLPLATGGGRSTS